MPDAYIDTTYVDAHLGRGFVTAVEDCDGISLVQQIESATGLVQSFLRQQGYATPTTTTDETVKLAVLACVMQSVCAIPEVSIELPDNWDTHPARLARDGILSGDAQVTHSITQISAEGGMEFSSATTYPQRSSRSKLVGY